MSLFSPKYRSLRSRLFAAAAALNFGAPAAAQDIEAGDIATLGASSTPDAAPSTGTGPSILLGGGPAIVPSYQGSKTFWVAPFPVVDIRGLFDGRVFVSTFGGLGATILDAGPLRGGVAVTYGGGRNSSSSARLRGLSDLTGGPEVSGFLTYSLKPFAFEIKAQNLFGPNPGTEVSTGLTYTVMPLAGLRVSVGPEVTWADSRYDKAYFGVTTDEAARATAEGNPLHAYTPGAGIKDVGLSANVTYQLTAHWGLSAHLGVADLIGNAAKNSPLTQRQLQPILAFGGAYRF